LFADATFVQTKQRMHFIVKYQSHVLAMIIGAIAGYAYYYFVGCTNGTCTITSNAANSTTYGALMGVLVYNSFKK
jgi:hypothetical protein